MRNVDEIKRLEHELGRMKKMVKDRDKQIEELKSQVQGIGQLREAMDAYMIDMCLRYGFAEEVGGEMLEHCMALTRGDRMELLNQWALQLYKGEKESEIILQAVKRESRAD